MPKRTKSHEIDELAQRIFREALPESWVIRRQEPDYSIDYLVEIFEAQEATGLTFAIQLKGTESPRTTGDSISFSVETDDIKYYLDKMRTPVFFVVVDTSCRIGYWIFIQEYVMEKLRGKKWRKQKTVTIRLPKSNLLRNTRQLLSEVKNADLFMARLHPEAINVSIKAQKEKLESLDPRFSVSIKASEKQEAIDIKAKEAVCGQFIFKGDDPDLVGKIRDFVQNGAPISFGPGEVKVEGSDLFQHIIKNGGTLKYQKSFNAEIGLVAVDTSGKELAKFDGFIGNLTGGTRKLSFHGELPRCPLFVKFILLLGADGKPSISSVGFGFDFGKWSEQVITLLPYFEQISSLLDTLRFRNSLKMECRRFGNLIFSAIADPEDLGQFRRLANTITIIEHAREIASILSLKTKLPKIFTENHIREIENLYWIFSKLDRPPINGNNLRLTMPLNKEGVCKLLSSASLDNKGELKIIKKPEFFSFLGEKVRLDSYVIKLSNAKMISEVSRLQEQLSKNIESITVEWVGTNKSKLSIKSFSNKNKDNL